MHRGQWVSFWQEACADNRPNGWCYFGLLASTHCDNGSGWACNEAGILLDSADAGGAFGPFGRGCDLGFAPACRNLTGLTSGLGPFEFARAQPTLEDYPIILRGTKGPIAERSPEALRAMACTQGWVEACRPAED